MAEETSSKYTKLRKRVKLAVGKPRRGIEGSVETLDFKKKGSQGSRKGQGGREKADSEFNVDDELHKRVKSGRNDGAHTRGSYRGGSDGDRRVESPRKAIRGNKKVGGRRIEDDNVTYVDEASHQRVIRGRDSELNAISNRASKVDDRYRAVTSGRGGFKTASSNGKRKRIYADNDSNLEVTFPKNLKPTRGNGLSQEKRDNARDDLITDRRPMRRGSYDSEQSNWGKSTTGRRKPNKQVIGERGGKDMGDAGKIVDRVRFSEQGSIAKGMLKKVGNSKSDSSTQLYQSQTQKKYGDDQPAKKKTRDKKNSSDDSAATDDRPKKKKRIHRLDPNDITNKRLDDTKPTIVKTTDSEEDSEGNTSAEISKNAQFRAIQPSPSILSFVEENLLGRRREIEFRRAGYNIELSAPLDNIPFSTSSERERIEETAFRNKLTFFAAAKISSSFPPPDLPEIAFAGRSNVGKSSLLNSLTRQWGVVRTSDKPGLTQTINFFNLGSKLCLVDLPGYGFAYAKEEVKESWEELVKEYVSTRVGLKRVCLLIDTKWGMKARDHELIELMERSKTKYQIVLTKTDLSFPDDVARRAMQIEESLKAKKSAVQPLMMVSSKTGAGIRSLRTVLANVARFARL